MEQRTGLNNLSPTDCLQPPSTLCGQLPTTDFLLASPMVAVPVGGKQEAVSSLIALAGTRNGSELAAALIHYHGNIVL